MSRALLVVMCVLVSARLSLAGSVVFDFGTQLTMTTTADQDAKLASFLAGVNAERAAQEPPMSAVTMEQYLQYTLTNTIRDQIRQGSAHESSQACTAYTAAASNVKNNIKADLGGYSPCP